MRLIFLPLTLCACLCAQAPRNSVPPPTVVAEIDGKKVTAGEMLGFIQAMPGQMPAFFDRDPKEFTRQFALMMKLTEMAEAQKLDQESPHKERLRYARMQVLMQGFLDQKSNPAVGEDQIEKHYNDRKADYNQALVKVLYISFVTPEQQKASAATGRKTLLEAEAKAKIDDLRKQVLAGADFVKLVKENSEEAMSRDKDGDYPPLKRSDAIPDPIKNAVFSLQPGGYSEVIRQPNGFYLFRLEKFDALPLPQVRAQVYQSLKETMFREWFEKLRAEVNAGVKFENEEFYKPGASAAPPPQQPKPAKP